MMAQEVKKIEVTRLRHTWSIAAALGYRYDKKHEAIGRDGAGEYAMQEQIVSDLSFALFGSGDKLRQETV